MKNYYTIEFYMPEPIGKWAVMCSFSYMNKSCADGAWAMLRAFYPTTHKYRLLKNKEVIDTFECSGIKVN